MKKNEKLFIIGILAAALVLWLVMWLIRRGNYQTIRITVNGEEYGTYSLSENQIIKIGDTNVCEIKDGKAKMTEADCPDQLCLHQHAIGESGGTIICLPNKVVIEGETGGDAPYDDDGFDTAT